MAILAVGGEIDGVASALQGGAELATQIRLVFDDQDPHLISLRLSWRDSLSAKPAPL
jgi:hypothetical protein